MLRILLIANLYHRLIYLLIQFPHISYQLCLIFLGIQPGIIVKYYLVDIYSNSVDFINEFLQNFPYFRIIIWFLTDKKTDILRIIFKSSSFIRSDDTSASTDPVWESIKISDAV